MLYEVITVLRPRGPFAPGLLSAVAKEVPVPVENAREHGLAHRGHHSRVYETRDRRAAGQRRVREEPVDAHPQRLHEPEARKSRERAGRRLGDECDSYNFV